MDNNYFEYKCGCKKACKSELYFQPDTIKNQRLIMLGTMDGADEANVWLTLDEAIGIANDLIKLANQLKENQIVRA